MGLVGYGEEDGKKLASLIGRTVDPTGFMDLLSAAADSRVEGLNCLGFRLEVFGLHPKP